MKSSDRVTRFWWFQFGIVPLLLFICVFEKGSLICLQDPCYNVCNPGDGITVDGNKVNVAFNQPAIMSSRHGNATLNFSGPACLAVNGNTSTTMAYMPALSNSIPSCVHSAVDTADRNPWWQVDLGQVYTVSSFVIYGRTNKDGHIRMRDAELQVDGKLCKRFPNDFNYPDSTGRIDDSCDPPLIGRRVTFNKTGSYGTDTYILNLCEIQIWVCKPGLYGQTCDRSCSWNCLNNQTCDNYHGTCHNGCADGYYSNKCESRCGQCAGDACAQTSGNCPAGCRVPGIQPPLCKDVCEDGKWDMNCSMECGNCQNSAACNNVNGSCVQCENHFQLPLCTECHDGYYGDTCSETCGFCLDNEVCDKRNGKCPSRCQAGYEAPLCRNECKNKTWGMNCAKQCGHCENSAACNVFNGSCGQCQSNFELPLCTACKDGYYGDECRESCGSCLNDKACGKSDGHCSSGCQPGYQAPLCKQVCQDKTWGNDCATQCGGCKDSAACNVFNGSCGQCEDKLQLPMCTDCVGGNYGENCSTPCGQCSNKVCDRETGNCDSGGCSEGFKGDRCDAVVQKINGDEDDNTPLIAGVVVAVAVVAVIAVVLVLIIRRRRGNAANKGSNGVSGRSRERLSQDQFTETPLTGGLVRGTEGEENGNKRANKPSVAVKPLRQEDQNQKNQDDHIYANAPQPSDPPPRPSPIPSPKPSPKKPKPPEKKPSPQTAPPVKEKELGASVENLFEDDDEGPIYGNVVNVYSVFKASKPVLDPVQKYLVDKLAADKLKAEFATIPKTVKEDPQEAGNLPKNFKKNRFAQIIPYDRLRVVLNDGYSDNAATDFINAGYIKGFAKERQYIASQGPRDNTVWDMWRMIWQEKITDIVMLTNLIEGQKPKCHLYWPENEGETETYGPVTVTNSRVETRECFVIRTFIVSQVSKKGEEREVTQYHFLSWPDHGAPETTSLVGFWRYVSSRTGDNTAPLLVHCSAGVGRTGTYIALDIGFQMAVQKGSVNLPELVKRLRQERTLMVQSVEQYVFLHEALFEAYTARDTAIPLDRFDAVFPQQITANKPNPRIEAEYKALTQMLTLSAQCSTDTGSSQENADKNRYSSILPLDNHIVYLTEHVTGRNQYINAVFMPTFRDPKGSILTQLPLPTTLIDFWRLVYGNDVTHIVSLSSPNEEQEVTPYCKYWPREKGKPIQTDPYTVTLLATEKPENNINSYSLKLQKKASASERPVQLLHYEGWEGEGAGGTSSILRLLDVFLSSTMDASMPKVIIQCSDGVSKSGLFSALLDVINQMTYTHEMDVYLATRRVHLVSPKAVSSLAQYQFLYQVAQERKSDMSVYANT